jgi:hypothetical protein
MLRGLIQERENWMIRVTKGKCCCKLLRQMAEKIDSSSTHRGRNRDRAQVMGGCESSLLIAPTSSAKQQARLRAAGGGKIC